MEEKTTTITSRTNLYMLILTALMAAITCVISPFAIPIGPVPISLCTLVLMFSVYILGTRYALVSCLLYLCLGFVGLPVFSGHSGGVAKLAGPTGGYIIGYLVLVALGGLAVDLTEKRYEKKGVLLRILQALGFIIATAVLYAFGTAWFMISTGTPLVASLGLCVIPFIPGDLVKIVLTVAVAPSLRLLAMRHANR